MSRARTSPRQAQSIMNPSGKPSLSQVPTHLCVQFDRFFASCAPAEARRVHRSVGSRWSSSCPRHAPSRASILGLLQPSARRRFPSSATGFAPWKPPPATHRRETFDARGQPFPGVVMKQQHVPGVVPVRTGHRHAFFLNVLVHPPLPQLTFEVGRMGNTVAKLVQMGRHGQRRYPPALTVRTHVLALQGQCVPAACRWPAARRPSSLAPGAEDASRSRLHAHGLGPSRLLRPWRRSRKGRGRLCLNAGVDSRGSSSRRTLAATVLDAYVSVFGCRTDRTAEKDAGQLSVL
jgi:hypothetical protein